MPVIPKVGRTLPIKLFIGGVYAALILLGLTMVVPFMITVSCSLSNGYDYQRFWPVPRVAWSMSDRWIKGLVLYFSSYRNFIPQMRANLPGMPESWTSWPRIADNTSGVDSYFNAISATPVSITPQKRAAAADYYDFISSCQIDDILVAVDDIRAADFLLREYMGILSGKNPELWRKSGGRERRRLALEILSREWNLPYESFYNIRFSEVELRYPLEHLTWVPPSGQGQYKDFIKVKEAYRRHEFTPGAKSLWMKYLRSKGLHFKSDSEVFPVTEKSRPEIKSLWKAFCAEKMPAPPTIPFSLRTAWWNFLRSEQARTLLKMRPGDEFTIGHYNRLSGESYKCIEETPFPLPARLLETRIGDLWRKFAVDKYPLRLVTFDVDAEVDSGFQRLVAKQLKTVSTANKLLGTDFSSWNDFHFSPSIPLGQGEAVKNMRDLWIAYAKTLPYEKRRLRSTESAWQEFARNKYGDVATLNKAYGTNYGCFEESFPPFLDAYNATFSNNWLAFTLMPMVENYRIVSNFLFAQARAVPVTLLLIVLSVICALTVNPVAAYAMSRFNMRGQEKVLIYMLATMAFPAMVSAIPAYLLMRDLGLLNTFLALVLPGAANGMAIFILKGFFDSLPMELFEAATIDGATEWQIFLNVAMPLVKPILAIKALTAFIAAYSGWEWALIICQKKEMWTVAVWLYQANQWWASSPWIVSAGFVVASIPTLIVFVFCQKVILGGIVIPTMK